MKMVINLKIIGLFGQKFWSLFRIVIKSSVFPDQYKDSTNDIRAMGFYFLL